MRKNNFKVLFNKKHAAPPPVPMRVLLLDFKNGIYEINGVAKTLADMMQADATWAPDWTPAYITAGTGWKTNGVHPADTYENGVLTPAAAAAISGTVPFTVITTAQLNSAPAGATSEAYIQYQYANHAGPDVWNGFLWNQYNASGAFVPNNTSSYDSGTSYATNTPDLTVSGLNKSAMLFSTANLGISENGAPGVAGGHAVSLASPDTFVFTTAANLTNNCILEKVEFWTGYDVADLQSLTSTPVPLVSADFKNGVYNIGGTSKTLADVCIEDTSWAVFNPAHVIPGTGFAPPNDGGFYGPVLSAAAYSSIGSDFIAVLTVHLSLSGSGVSSVTLEAASLPAYNENQGTMVILSSSNPSRIEIHGTGGEHSTDVKNPIADGWHKVAFLLSNSITASGDGEPNVSTGMLTPMTNRNAIGFYNYATGTTVCVTEKIEFFSTSEYTTADLPILSA